MVGLAFSAVYFVVGIIVILGYPQHLQLTNPDNVQVGILLSGGALYFFIRSFDGLTKRATYVAVTPAGVVVGRSGHHGIYHVWPLDEILQLDKATRDELRRRVIKFAAENRFSSLHAWKISDEAAVALLARIATTRSGAA